MSELKKIIKTNANALLRVVGLEVAKDSKNEGFDKWLSLAKKSGMDVNDWLEVELGWKNALPVLDKVLFPYLSKNSIVCEIGPGTGRQSRHIAAKIKEGALHLVDHSMWCYQFLRRYFRSNHNVAVHLGNECSLDFLADDSCDVVFSNGTFIGLKLGIFYIYSLEFFRILKPGGYCVFDYIDISTREGWDYLENQSGILGHYFTYHTTAVIDKLFTSSGFEIVGRHQVGESTYIIMKKNSGTAQGVHNEHR